MSSTKTPAATTATPKTSDPNPTPRPANITLEQLAADMKLTPRDARMLLRLAAKQTKLYPTLAKEHVARQPWSWAPVSKALEEARTALSTKS